MARPKERNEAEHFKGIIRNLRSEIRHLKKELGRLNKLHQYEQDRLTEAVEEVVTEIQAIAPVRCPECSSDSFKKIALGNRILESCQSCGYRKGRKLHE